MTSPRGGSRTFGKRLIGDNAAHDHAAARGRPARRGRADAGLRARHRPSRCARAGRHRHDGAAPGGRRPRSPPPVQRQELEDARSEDDYTIREWVDAPDVRYVPVDGELELLPGLRLVPAPGHTRGMQVVVVETGGRPVVVGGDVAVWFGELDEPHTEGQLRVRALDPELVWLAHEHEPWRPRTVRG